MRARLDLALVVAAVAIAACQKTDGTFAILKFQGSVPAGTSIQSIKVELQLGTHTDAAAFNAAAGTTITLPTTGVLEIRAGEGDLSVTATALADDGRPVAIGSGNGRITSGTSTTIPVTFKAIVADTDAGAGAPEAGADKPAGDTAGQGGVDGAIVGGGGTIGAGGTTATTLGGGGTIGAGGTAVVTGGTIVVASGGSGGTTVIGQGGASGSDAADVAPSFVIGLSASTIDLGPAPVGGVSPPQTLTVTNMGNVVGPPLIIFINDGHHFPLSQDRCSGATLAPGSSCTIAFTFNPDAPGPLRTDGAVSGGSEKVRFFLSGNGANPPSTLNLSPQSVDFMFVDLGITPSVAFTVTNKAAIDSGAIKVTASPIASFRISNDQCANVTLGPQGQCTFSLVFAPQTIGPVSGAVLAESATSSAKATATGTGQDHVQLIIGFEGTGGGSVTGPNLNCRSIGGACSMGFVRTDPNAWPGISLSAAPNALSVFAGWEGACTGVDNCVVTMDGPKKVIAKFNTR